MTVIIELFSWGQLVFENSLIRMTGSTSLVNNLNLYYDDALT